MASIRSYRTSLKESRFEVRWRDGAGRDRCKTFKLKADALRFKVEVERRQQLGELYEAPPETFGTFVEGWLARYERLVRPGTYQRAVEALRHFRDFAPRRLDDMRAADLEDRVTAIANDAPRQAQLAMQYAKQVLKSAQARGQRVDARVFELRPPRVESREPRFLAWHEVEELAAACVEDRMVLLAALTGLRQGELFALRDSRVDLERGLIIVDVGAYEGRATATKTRKSRRRVYLSRLAKVTLTEQLLARKPNDDGLVFPSPKGLIWRKDNFMGRVFRPARRRAGFDELTFHDLRHTYASLMIEAGVSPLVIAEQMGHSDARLALQRYGHLYPGASERAAQALDNVTRSEGAVGEAWGQDAAR
jgi:integrase